jgi:hypothetical protein
MNCLHNSLFLFIFVLVFIVFYYYYYFVVILIHLFFNILTGFFSSLTKDALIKRLLDMGYWIGVFGPHLDDEAVQQRFISLGVQLVCSDRPDILRKTINSLSSLPTSPAPVSN